MSPASWPKNQICNHRSSFAWKYLLALTSTFWSWSPAEHDIKSVKKRTWSKIKWTCRYKMSTSVKATSEELVYFDGRWNPGMLIVCPTWRVQPVSQLLWTCSQSFFVIWDWSFLTNLKFDNFSQSEIDQSNRQRRPSEMMVSYIKFAHSVIRDDKNLDTESYKFKRWIVSWPQQDSDIPADPSMDLNFDHSCEVEIDGRCCQQYQQVHTCSREFLKQIDSQQFAKYQLVVASFKS